MSAPASGEPGADRIRRVLDAPRGQRFVRPGAAHRPTWEERLLAQMRDNPRVAYRQAHGELPHWMRVQAARMAERDAQRLGEPDRPDRPRKPSPAPPRPPEPALPRPRPAPDDGPFPPRPKRPPLPRRRSQRPQSHRRPPRLRWALPLAGYTLAATVGALAHHLTAGLF
ncbi:MULTISPECIES: hypothetical protein [unclassified Nocardiopsis]|uniref:hypothetical protein n=1 Tax=unclassified Nocardiopsis TaxID=2649073 RepID=UPI0013593393|nr:MULTISPECIES: hypothetical protein [unclassified Nocardiopsis]